MRVVAFDDQEGITPCAWPSVLFFFMLDRMREGEQPHRSRRGQSVGYLNSGSRGITTRAIGPVGTYSPSPIREGVARHGKSSLSSPADAHIHGFAVALFKIPGMPVQQIEFECLFLLLFALAGS